MTSENALPIILIFKHNRPSSKRGSVLRSVFFAKEYQGIPKTITKNVDLTTFHQLIMEPVGVSKTLLNQLVAILESVLGSAFPKIG